MICVSSHIGVSWLLGRQPRTRNSYLRKYRCVSVNHLSRWVQHLAPLRVDHMDSRHWKCRITFKLSFAYRQQLSIGCRIYQQTTYTSNSSGYIWCGLLEGKGRSGRVCYSYVMDAYVHSRRSMGRALSYYWSINGHRRPRGVIGRHWTAYSCCSCRSKKWFWRKCNLLQKHFVKVSVCDNIIVLQRLSCLLTSRRVNTCGFLAVRKY